MEEFRPESETIVETTTFTRTVSHGRQLENIRRVLRSARKTASELGLENYVGLIDDFNAALSDDEQAANDAQGRVTKSLNDAATLIAELTSELTAAQGATVTQSMLDKATGIKNLLGQIDPDAVVAPPADGGTPPADGSTPPADGGDGTAPVDGGATPSA